MHFSWWFQTWSCKSKILTFVYNFMNFVIHRLYSPAAWKTLKSRSQTVISGNIGSHKLPATHVYTLTRLWKGHQGNGTEGKCTCTWISKMSRVTMKCLFSISFLDLSNTRTCLKWADRWIVYCLSINLSIIIIIIYGFYIAQIPRNHCAILYILIPGVAYTITHFDFGFMNTLYR